MSDLVIRSHVAGASAHGEVVAVDIGGTHARFALAEVREGRVLQLGAACTLKTAEHESLEVAWRVFAREAGRPLLRAAAIAFAGPVQGEMLKLTNNGWIVRPDRLKEEIGVERLLLINDFGAVGHAVAQLGEEHFRHLCGPEALLPDEGVISIVGPGTGLGVAMLRRHPRGYEVIETEGGHIDFAPIDSIDDEILAFLRKRFGRVSVERLASGSGLRNIHDALAEREGQSTAIVDDKALWAAALNSSDRLASVALERFFFTLGSVAGDVALVQGAKAVVIAGGLGLRLADRLGSSGFAGCFVAKGRFQSMMETMPVKILTHEQPGLFGAAAAFAKCIA
ncbi:MAG TPA: glucokinase [Allosphingosinicella sp.]|uniref:glucokinase n=1 Tax=Allosphingosinicella sp. TaxID=2823234 RepID=UPI002ED7F7BC